jgi:hypothetical protein
MIAAFFVLSALVAGPPDPAGQGDPLGIGATQLTIRLGREQFRATVVAKRGDLISILTAAHCVNERDKGAPLLLRHGKTVVRGRVVDATQNPDYRPVPSRDPASKAVRGVLCVDNAWATIRLEPTRPEEGSAIEHIAVAEVAPTALVGTRIRTMNVHIIDQDEREHHVAAGNHLNPKCLAWGRASFQPQPGDSGAGVFFVQDDEHGKPRALLVGNVALADDRGGIAPLVNRSSHWVEAAFAKPDTPQPR